MPTIYDNIETDLLPAVRNALEVSYRADFCVGYLNLRGWKHLHDLVGRFKGGDGQCCRLLVGMPTSPDREVRDALSLGDAAGRIDTATAVRRKKELAAGLKTQLTVGVPTDEDEQALRRLAAQLRARIPRTSRFTPDAEYAKLYHQDVVDALNALPVPIGTQDAAMLDTREA